MGKLLNIANTKDQLDRNIADEAARLKQEDMTLTIYEAIEKAKEFYLGKESKGND